MRHGGLKTTRALLRLPSTFAVTLLLQTGILFADDDLSHLSVPELVKEVASPERHRAYLAENRLIAIGEPAVEEILRVVEDKKADPRHRKSLCLILDEIGSPSPNARLLQLFTAMSDFDSRNGILSALHHRHEPEVRQLHETLLTHEEEYFRGVAILSLTETKDPAYLKRAITLLEDPSPGVRDWAVKAIQKYDTLTDEARQALLKHFEKETEERVWEELQEAADKFDLPLPAQKAGGGPPDAVATPEGDGTQAGTPSLARQSPADQPALVPPDGISAPQSPAVSRDVGKSYKDGATSLPLQREPVKDMGVFFWLVPVAAVLTVAVGAYLWIKRKTK